MGRIPNWLADKLGLPPIIPDYPEEKDRNTDEDADDA